MKSRCAALLLVLLFLSVTPCQAGPSADFQPDPKSVQRYGPAYRYPQAGWIVLHIEGQPYERGYQHGRLMAPEISAFVRRSANMISPKAPADGWKTARTLINSLFVRRYEKEYLEEMKGIADGASAAGARFENRPIDLVDIVGLNVWPELETLDSALEATPTGLEGMRFPNAQPRAMPDPKPMHCSAFAATGPATADGKMILGHITMFSLYASYFYNVWLDVKPSNGHRVFMQSYPGGIQSGLDYYMNDVGLVVAETTIAQTKFDVTGQSVASRIRQALQYADSIDKAVEILAAGNNGLYTNEWLLGDAKTNEIAMFELGTAKSRLYRSSKNEWFGGTAGFYWGCNNTKDRDVRLETIPGVHGRPANMVFCPTDRDKTWLRLYEKHKGKMDVNFGKEAFTTPPLCAHHSLDAKYTTSDLAKENKTWALFGPPLGRTWQPTEEEKERYPDIRPLVSNPWTILHSGAPAPGPSGGSARPERDVAAAAVDLPESLQQTATPKDEPPVSTKPAWHGTILPKTAADTWLATAFADYERMVAYELALHEHRDTAHEGKLTDNDLDRLGCCVFGARSSYLTSARKTNDVPLAKTTESVTQSDWYHIAAGKGFLLLHELRQLMGIVDFYKMMDSFGREHAGKEVTTAEFQAHAERASRKPLDQLFEFWLRQPGLPTLRLGKVSVDQSNGESKVNGEILLEGQYPPSSVSIVLQTDKGEETKSIALHGPVTPFTISTSNEPLRLIVDKYGRTAKANGGIFSTLSFYSELENTLIVYGTEDELATNHEAAQALQRAIMERHANYSVSIKKDKEVTESDLKSNHLLLIGRPDSNSLVKRFSSALPVTFGTRSFTVRNDTYAHAGSAVCAAAENPSNPRYSMVVIAGLSAESTLSAAPALLAKSQREEPVVAEVLLLPNKAPARALVVPAPELVKDLQLGNGYTKK